MKNYFEHMGTKSTHERRQHALQVAGVVTAVVFVVWISTLGVRLAYQASGSGQTAATTYSGNTLVASSSSQY